METEFVNVVTIRDETYHTYRTIQLTKNAILNLRGEYLVYRDALNHNKNIKLYKSFIIFVKTINEAINRFKIDKIIMDDEDDTEIGLEAAEDEITFTINADISFEQIIETESNQNESNQNESNESIINEEP